MAGETQHGPAAVRLELTVPCDPRFRDLLESVSRRMAAYIGYADADAEAIAGAVMQATGGLLGGAAPAAYASLDLTFATSAREMEILLRYVRRGRKAPPDAPGVEHVLRRAGGGAALDALQRTMERVELGRRDGIEFCRLTKLLPEDDTA